MIIKKSDIIRIIPKRYSNPFGINYEKWIEFIEFHNDYFIWFENTENGTELSKNLDQVPDWAKEGALYKLNKTNAYSTNKIVKYSFDLIVRYFREGIIQIDIEKNMTKKMAKILLKMAVFLDGKLIINDAEELKNIGQLN